MPILVLVESKEVEAEDEEDGKSPGIGEAPVGRFPYMCSLRRRGSREHICGGTLVGKQWVLTAAHCIDPELTGTLGLSPIVYCGIHNVSSEVGNLSFAAIDSVIHEQWSGSPVDGYDIALVKLDRETNLAVPGLNPSGNSIGMNTLLAALGWGATPSDPNPEALQLKTSLNHVSHKTCNALWEGIIVEDIMLCAGIGEKDTCRGDAGGPLLVLDAPRSDIANGEPRFDLLVGLTSFGSDNCGQGTRPGVYTDISFFSKWVYTNMAEEYDPTED